MMNMLLSLLLALLSSREACGFTTVGGGRSLFAVPAATLQSQGGLGMSHVVLDVGDATKEFNYEKLLAPSSGESLITIGKEDSAAPLLISIDDAQAASGMPWKESIDNESPLLYMKFWEWQIEFMKLSLTNLEVVKCEDKFEYNENLKKKARIVSLCFKSDEYRKIRMTYYDAGENCQVFNSVWYPDTRYNLPILGADLLSFNRKKYLAIVDFQPIHEREEDHTVSFENILKPIKEGYTNLKGRMSSKFYDETKFFSQELLFARFDDESIVNSELYPAFQRYVMTHVDLLRDCSLVKEDSKRARDKILKRHTAYDTYSAERDPATGFFAAMFGKDWADSFVHEFLFSLSERKEEVSSQDSKAEQPSRP